MDVIFDHTRISAVQLLGRPERWPADAVYVGMPGKAARAWGIEDEDVPGFGKPWALMQDPRGWLPAYREYLFGRIKASPEFAAKVASLHGKTLVCWCASRPSVEACHAQTLARAAEWLAHQAAPAEPKPKRARAPRKPRPTASNA